MSDKYMYLFIREDLSTPQQIIQTSHAAHVIGKNQECDSVPNAVLIGAKTEYDLLGIKEYLDYFEIAHEMFYEPDISQHTAIATYPLVGDQRLPLRKFDLMR